MKTILAADIGGTNSRFAHFTADDAGALSLMGSHWLETKGAGSFDDLIDQLAAAGFSLPVAQADAAVIAVAGPVEDGLRSDPPFIDWSIDLEGFAGPGGPRRAVLINDFAAQAFATKTPAAAAAEPVLPGKSVPGAATAVIGAGTGLGMAALVSDGSGGCLAVSSEGGHQAFPFLDPRELEFRRFLERELHEPYPTGNSVVSGSGLALLHRFLTGEEVDQREIGGRLAAGSETLAWGARFYGRVCRDFALAVLARGGLYIAGGVAARTPALVHDEAFAAEFRLSGTMRDLLADIPVFLMTDQESGLWGAARRGIEELRTSPDPH